MRRRTTQARAGPKQECDRVARVFANAGRRRTHGPITPQVKVFSSKETPKNARKANLNVRQSRSASSR
jgi:hypothetical protein